MRFLSLSILLFLTSPVLAQNDFSSLEEMLNDYPDSVRQISIEGLSKSESNKTRASYFHLIALSYQFNSNWDLAIKNFISEDSLLQTLEPDVGCLIKNKQQHANSLYYKGALVESDKLLQEALSLLPKSNNYHLNSEVLLDAGWLARERGRHAEALDYYFEAKKLAEANNDQSLLAECFSKIAVVYHVMSEFKTAKTYYDKSLEILIELNEQGKIARLYNNYGLLSQYQSNTSEAVSYYERSIEMCDSMGNARGVAIANENLGILCYEDLGNYTMALKRFKKSLNYWRSANDIYGQSQTLVYILNVYNLQDNFNGVIDSGHKALTLSIEAGAKDVERDALNELSKAYEGLGNTSLAYLYYKRHIVLRDSLQALNKLEEIKLIGIQNELVAKQLKDSLDLAIIHEQESAEVELKIKEQRFWTGLSFSAVVALAIIMFLVFRGNRQRKKSALEIEEANMLLKTKNNEIIDSITYAKRIQNAILPSQETIHHHFNNSFIYYLPKDIVAGDFYWIEEAEENNVKTTLFAVADCTGHGVPGAMVSVICSNALNKAVRENKLSDPAEILEKVTQNVVETFEKSDNELKDGMDISLVSLTYLNDKIILKYAGANNPLWIVKAAKTVLIETKATKRPIGRYTLDTPFITRSFELDKNDVVYLFSDGYADQFGGEKNKKFKYKTLKTLLLDIHNKPLDEQHQILHATFSSWKGSFEQVDDVCIAGIRV